ncbi:cell division protein FtsA [Candidatus Shapirobacteria bacterium]|nr:cell division protein FtsA [Candidatus Shapirobacteria bacterium]
MARSKTLAALDVGSTKIAALIAQTNEEGILSVIGSASLPSRGIKRGQIINIEEATEVIIATVEAAERMAGLNVGHLWVSGGGPQIISQNSRGVVAVGNPGGEINEEDIRRVLESAQAISLPASREIIHVIPRQFTVDSQEGIADPTGMSGIRLEVETHIITASSTALRNLRKCVDELGAHTDGVVFDGLASAAAVVTPTEKELGVISIDIGGGTTSVVLYAEGSPIYSSVLPIGAQNITSDLAIGLRLSLEEAENLKVTLGNYKNIKDDKEIDLKLGSRPSGEKKITKKMIVEEIIQPRLEEIFTMINEEIRRNDYQNLAPAGVVLTGGGAQTVAIEETCRRIMALPVRQGVPCGLTGLVDDILAPEFATAIGLILWGQQHQGEEFRSNSSRIRKKMPSLPWRESFEKVINFIKSFLP